MIGTVVGSYRIVGEIGSGGMGTIYRAEHTLLGKPAAVKVLNPQYAQSRTVVNRFFNEARAATAIQHPSIVEVFDFGYMPDGAAYIVMEFLKGESLGHRLYARGRLLESEAFAILRGIAGALGAAHQRGIVHRDIKPDNVFLVPDPEMPSGERVKLLDFGIAKLSEEQNAGWSQTRTGTVLGTPSYMAPEQCAGAREVDARADLYSLGCMLFEMLAGRPPFLGQGAGEIIGQHQFVPAPRLRDVAPGASREADDIVAALLAKRPEDRVQTAADVIRMLGAPGAVKAAGSHTHVTVGAAGEIHSPTTLGGAPVAFPSPSAVQPPRRRLGVVLGAGAVIAIAGIAVIVAASSSDPPATAAAPDAAAGSAVAADGGSLAGSAIAVDAGAPDPTPPDAATADAPALVDAASATAATPPDAAPRVRVRRKIDAGTSGGYLEIN